jgi:hypothetical protein
LMRDIFQREEAWEKTGASSQTSFRPDAGGPTPGGDPNTRVSPLNSTVSYFSHRKVEHFK